MTKAFFVISICLLFISCNKSPCDDGFLKLSPVEYNIYLELLKSDGGYFEDDEVLITSKLKITNGELMPSYGDPISWYELGEIDYYSDTLDIKLFGTKCESCEAYYGMYYAFGLYDECSIFGSWEEEQYYLIKYPNQETDTLLIRDVKLSGIHRSFEFYINNEPKELLNQAYYSYLQVIQQEH